MTDPSLIKLPPERRTILGNWELGSTDYPNADLQAKVHKSMEQALFRDGYHIVETIQDIVAGIKWEVKMVGEECAAALYWKERAEYFERRLQELSMIGRENVG